MISPVLEGGLLADQRPFTFSCYFFFSYICCCFCSLQLLVMVHLCLLRFVFMPTVCIGGCSVFFFAVWRAYIINRRVSGICARSVCGVNLETSIFRCCYLLRSCLSIVQLAVCWMNSQTRLADEFRRRAWNVCMHIWYANACWRVDGNNLSRTRLSYGYFTPVAKCE